MFGFRADEAVSFDPHPLPPDTPPVTPQPRAKPARMTPAEAAALIDSGGLVLVPTETVFGVAASASNPEALTRLWSVLDTGTASAARPPALAWHAPTAARASEIIRSALGAVPSTHARVLDRLTPGPVLLAVAMPESALGAFRAALAVPAGVTDDSREALIRVPSHSAASALLSAAKSPVVMAGVTAPRRLRDTEDALSMIESLSPVAHIDAVIDSPPPPLGKPSTMIRLQAAPGTDPRGTYEVVREGVYDAPFIERRLARNILFICTGNTCRSPMAQAIARHVLESAARPVPGVPRVTIDSAGVSAYPGAPATPEAVQALAALGIKPQPHASMPLTRAMLSDAEAVFAMTASHAHAAKSIEPASAHKVSVLDPQGADIPDPIGGPLAVYHDTARTIRESIEARFAELGLFEGPR